MLWLSNYELLWQTNTTYVFLNFRNNHSVAKAPSRHWPLREIPCSEDIEINLGQVNDTDCLTITQCAA